MIFSSTVLNIAIFGGIFGSLSFPVIYSVLNKEGDVNTHLFKEYKVENKTPQTFSQMTPVQHSYIDLIKGDNSYNSGNYVMYVGSEFCPYCNLMLYAEKDSDPNSTVEDKAISLQHSKWNKAYEYGISTEKLGTTLKFIMYSDGLKTENEKQQTLPWNTYEQDETNSGKIKGDYIRHDESAINFRKIREALQTKISADKTKFIPTVIFYKSGKPFVLNSDKFKEIEESDRVWNELNPKAEGKEQPERVRNRLIEFMVHLYKKNSELVV